MKRILHWALGVLGMLLSISLAVTLTLGARWLYVIVMEREDIPEYTGYSREEILANYDAVIEYNSVFGPEKLEFPTLPMSDGGRIHFEEVKVIFVALQFIGIASFVILAAYAAFAIVKKRKDSLSVLRNTGILSVAVPSAVGIGVALNWDMAFVIFHKIFFANDLWLFDPYTDPVIRILPDTYFLACAVMIISLVILSSILCLTAYFILKKKTSGQPTVKSR